MFETIVMGFSGFLFTFCVFQSHKNLNCHSFKGIWRCKNITFERCHYRIILLYKTKLNFITVLSSHQFVIFYKTISLRIFSYMCLLWRWIENIRLYYDCESLTFILFYTVGNHCLEGKICFHWSQCRDLNTRPEILKGLHSCNSVRTVTGENALLYVCLMTRLLPLLWTISVWLTVLWVLKASLTVSAAQGLCLSRCTPSLLYKYSIFVHVTLWKYHRGFL